MRKSYRGSAMLMALAVMVGALSAFASAQNAPAVTSVEAAAPPGPAVTLPPTRRGLASVGGRVESLILDSKQIRTFVNSSGLGGTLASYQLRLSTTNYAALNQLLAQKTTDDATQPKSAETQKAAKAFSALRFALRDSLKGRRGPPNPAPVTAVHAGRGLWLSGSGTPTAIYANHTIYPDLKLKISNDYLYAPTAIAPARGCIEVVTKYSAGAPQVWFWDWCHALPTEKEPVVRQNVDANFIRDYVRRMPNGFDQYTVENVLLPDGKTWVAQLYNYTQKSWTFFLYSAGTRDSLISDLAVDKSGWDFFETYTGLNGPDGSADICQALPGPIVASEISISYDPALNKSFKRVDGQNSSQLSFDQLYCQHFKYSSTNPFDWLMSYL